MQRRVHFVSLYEREIFLSVPYNFISFIKIKVEYIKKKNDLLFTWV